VNPEELKQDAIDAVEQHGIVFIDEIDKICKRGETSGPDVSRDNNLIFNSRQGIYLLLLVLHLARTLQILRCIALIRLNLIEQRP
ncbi:AAA family ATPase, partial [Salmonella enterica subsp. enterica serovar Cerro]|nr:AAA family ATPase [Salmonella enterica subsp. enterica serovar Cerro]